MAGQIYKYFIYTLFTFLLLPYLIFTHPVLTCNCNTNFTVYTYSGGENSQVKIARVSVNENVPARTSGKVSGLETSNKPPVQQPKVSITDKISVSNQDDSDLDICLEPDCVMAAARILESMDTNVNPCYDFFEYACGKWNRMNVIPSDRSSYDKFSEMRDELETRLKNIFEEPIGAKAWNPVQQLHNFYDSCISDDKITSLGLSPLRSFLKSLGGWPILEVSQWDDNTFDLEALMAKLRLYNNKVLVDQWVSPDDKNSNLHIIQLDQAPLGLPSRDYYVNAKENPVVQSYEKFAVKVAVALGADESFAKQEMGKMIDFEIHLSNITASKGERRDNNKIYKKMTVKQLMQNITSINVLKYLQLIFAPVNVTVTENEEVVVYAMNYFKELSDLIPNTEKRVLANYLIWRIMMNRLNSLGKPYRDLKEEFDRMLLGQEGNGARWRECVTFVKTKLGNIVGRLFIEKHFDEEAKRNALSMVKYIRNSFIEAFPEIEWLDEKTRIVAKEKAEAIQEMIGYDSRILNNTYLELIFENINFDANKYFDNILSLANVMTKQVLGKLRKPVDKTEWTTTPAIVNAFYSTAKNQIYFPAAILQPPFYSKGFPQSLNFGGIGMVIGHEITHGFDDRGRIYDKDGNMKQWWDDQVIERFKKQAQCIIEHYGNFTIPSINKNVNGVFSQGENIADNGGLKYAYRAYKKWLQTEHNGKEEPRLPGLSHINHDKLFFINFAQVWCGTLRPQAALNNVRIGNHCPGQFRVLGTLQNSQEFAKTFNCPLNSYMNPERKCKVW